MEKEPKLTYDEAADYLGLPINTIRLAVRRGQLKVIRYNKQVVRFTIKALDDYDYYISNNQTMPSDSK
jgi:excisionase family DNA binding protein